ncbi:MAG TPA: fluoride efflux transporter CrcB [Alloacidobacterium sp.]|nr:fluoride efflux transporter CrcB [Alloacidobacterium sp.]
MEKYFYIAIGGSLGSIARYWVGTTVSDRLGSKFPYGTFIINISACIIIGFAITCLGKHVELNPAWRFLIPVGFVGAYSTFSTYEWETLSSIRTGAFALAVLYSLTSVVLGILAAWAGAILAEVIT